MSSSMPTSLVKCHPTTIGMVIGVGILEYFQLFVLITAAGFLEM